MVKAAEAHPNCAFGIMFQLRTSPIYQKLRIAHCRRRARRADTCNLDRHRLVPHERLLRLRRLARHLGRRGGGVLINQCPHNMDAIQWVTGMMPNRVTAVGTIGKTHPIEVEDEVSAILEYPNGAVGQFITTTAKRRARIAWK